MKIDYQFGISTHPLKEYDLKEAHAKKLTRLLNLEESALILMIGQHYLRNFIPAPIENEDEYWMCSCFPGNYNTPLRFNIYWHEVLNILRQGACPTHLFLPISILFLFPFLPPAITGNNRQHRPT
jgi:hypothetical protein